MQFDIAGAMSNFAAGERFFLHEASTGGRHKTDDIQDAKLMTHGRVSHMNTQWRHESRDNSANTCSNMVGQRTALLS